MKVSQFVKLATVVLALGTMPLGTAIANEHHDSKDVAHSDHHEPKDAHDHKGA